MLTKIVSRPPRIGTLSLIVFASATIFSATSLWAQDPTVSRWALGRPSLVIDLPGRPGPGGVTWAEQQAYTFFPNSWSAEGSGVRIETARLYAKQTPSELLAETGRKLAVPISGSRKGQISGRELAAFSNDTRTIYVIGHDGGVFGGASWVVVATYRDAAGRSLSQELLDSIRLEREGARNWALRSLGRTFIAAEMPFEVVETSAGTGPNRTRYEVTFDGMDVSVTNETPGEGRVLDVKTSLGDLVERERTRAGISDFTAKRDRYKLDSREGELVTVDFKRAYRNYRVYKIAFIEARRGVVVNITIDPNRADHQKAAERIFRSMKQVQNPIYGWKTYAIGDGGFFVDLPVAPGPARQQNALTIYDSNSPLAPVEIREIEVGFPGGHSPDASAKQYFEFRTALHKDAKYDPPVIEKRLINGLEARLVKAKWTNGKNENNRQMLIIYGYSRQWIVDMLTSKETTDYMDRVMQSVQVKVDFPARFRRQSIGQTGASFLVGEQPIKTNVTANPNDPTFAREELGMAELSNGVVLVTYEMTMKVENPPVTDERGVFYFNSFLSGMAGTLGMKLSGRLRDSFEINIDGVEGRHLIFDLISDKMPATSVVQGDFVLLQQDKRLWTAIVMTNYAGGLGARNTRARILNSLRVGM